MNIFYTIRDNIFNRISKTSGRSKDAIKNIGVSAVAKGISILASLIMVPLTINYVNPTQYGIWLAISSLVGWVTYFNFGFSNGFRNRFTEAIAHNDDNLARQYVSTTYFALGFVVTLLLIVTLIANAFIDWSSFLKIDVMYCHELKIVFGTLCIIFCMNMVLRIFCTMLIADQKPGLEAIISCLGQLLSLLCIFLMTKFTTGSLINLAAYFSGVPTFTILVASIIGFSSHKYKKYAPSVKTIRFKLIKNILGLGIKFFVINLCMIAIFQVINIVLTREVGPDSVTQYNIAYKYFNILYTFMIIIITPFWSAFTDAYAKNDYLWMNNTVKKLERMWLVSIIVGLIILLFSSWFYQVWVGDSVSIPFTLSLLMLVFMLMQIISGIYMYVINGMGFVHLQMIIYILFALISWSLLSYSCSRFGVNGVLIAPTLVYCAQAIIAKIQINKILSKQGSGIWIK